MFWDSDWVPSDRSFDILHGGTPLICDEEYRIEISVDFGSHILRKKADFSTGLFTADENALWIGTDTPCVSPLLRNTFFAGRKAKCAKAYVCSTGFFRLYINDKYIGTRQAVPNFTQNGDCYFDTFDITDFVTPDNNTIGVWLAENKISDLNNDLPLAATVIITMTYYDGTSKRFYSDGDWIWHESPIIGIRDGGGETYNKNNVIKKWSNPYINTSEWKTVTTLSLAPAKPVFAEKTAKIGTVPAKFFEARDDEVTFCDFGQSSFGRLKIIITGEPGTKIFITYYENLLPDGTPDILSGTEDEYIIKGYEIEAYEPRFSARFFRFAEVRMDGVAQLIYAEKVNIGTHSNSLVKLRCPSQSALFECEKILTPFFKNLSERLNFGQISLSGGTEICDGNADADAPLYFEEWLLRTSPENYCKQFFMLNFAENATPAHINAVAANEICKEFGIYYGKYDRTVYINSVLQNNCDEFCAEYLSPSGLIGVYLRRIGDEVHEDCVIPVGTDAVVTLPDGTIKTLICGKYLYEQN